MKSWQDIYDVIREDATAKGTIYRPAHDGEPETMCVMGGLALTAGLDIRQGNNGEAVWTTEALDFVVDNYPLTFEQCAYLVRVNDNHEDVETRRAALIAQVRKYEAQETA